MERYGRVGEGLHPGTIAPVETRGSQSKPRDRYLRDPRPSPRVGLVAEASWQGMSPLAGARVFFKHLGTALAIRAGVYSTFGKGEHGAQGGHPDQWSPDQPLSDLGDPAICKNTVKVSRYVGYVLEHLAGNSKQTTIMESAVIMREP